MLCSHKKLCAQYVKHQNWKQTTGPRSSGQQSEAAEPNSLSRQQCSFRSLCEQRSFWPQPLLTDQANCQEISVSRGCFLRQLQCRMTVNSSKLSHYLPLGQWDKEEGSVLTKSAQLVSSKFSFKKKERDGASHFETDEGRVQIYQSSFEPQEGVDQLPFSFHILCSRSCKQRTTHGWTCGHT